VTTECPITTGVFDGFSWIRCEGKCSFLNSPIVKAFGDARIAAGERLLVVDLGACTGMDSTFMGTLAGLATRLTAQNGALQVADADSRSRRSLEDLGLDFLMAIDPPEAPWRGSIAKIRESLSRPEAASAGRIERTKHVLEAHQTLSGANESNAKAFSGVVSMLESELAEKQRRTDDRKR
jgi:anti-anti-sigma regulatory factor